MPERPGIIIGGIYRHCGNSRHQYETVDVFPNASHYEETGEIVGETVIYRQLYGGGFPKGTIWARDAADFNGQTEIKGRKIKKFKLVEKPDGLALPEFATNRTIKETANFRVVMDWKPGLEDQPEGERFYIEPKTDEAEEMLFSAAQAHNIPNFNKRNVVTETGIRTRLCLRADFIIENLGPIFFRETVVPEEGKGSVPSPDRMEECLEQGHKEYSFEDWVLLVSPQFKMTPDFDKSLLL